MKKLVLAASIFLSQYALSDCLTKKPVSYLPVGVLTEFCFSSEISKAKYGSPFDFQYVVENSKDLPSDYQDDGIMAVISVTPMRPGIVSNFIVDTYDGKRAEFTIITTSSNAE